MNRLMWWLGWGLGHLGFNVEFRRVAILTGHEDGYAVYRPGRWRLSIGRRGGA